MFKRTITLLWWFVDRIKSACKSWCHAINTHTCTFVYFCTIILYHCSSNTFPTWCLEALIYMVQHLSCIRKRCQMLKHCKNALTISVYIFLCFCVLCSMFPVFMDFPILIAPSVFSNVYINSDTNHFKITCFSNIPILSIHLLEIIPDKYHIYLRCYYHIHVLFVMVGFVISIPITILKHICLVC